VFLAAAMAATGPVSAQEVVAVLASDQRAQRETFESFQAAFGKAVPLLPLGEAPPAAVKVVLAFGGKAALQDYPRRAAVVYAIAPGALVERGARGGPAVKVMMEPEPAALLAALTSLQPGLKRLAVPWTSAPRAAGVRRLIKIGAARGVELYARRLEDEEALPRWLRGLEGKVDAIWLPPDPLLINAKTFAVLKHYSYDNDVPLYVPTEGLAEQGATAAVSVSYGEMGLMMAEAARSVLADRAVPAELYASRVRVCVNRSAAEAAALHVLPEALKAADRVLP
jgi:ABC-type uncharacterized transport system substrate-binding protein